jgi:phosphate transport system substrate-binding protein
MTKEKEGSMTIKRLLLVLAVAASLAFVAAGCGDANDNSSSDGAAASGDGGSADVSGNIAGAGSSAQDAAMQSWIAGLQSSSPDATVSYDPVGSGGGREQFVSKGVDFAGSDSALADDELKGAQDRCGGPDNLIEIPVYVSPIAVIYNLDGVDDLQLSPETAAKIFAQKITKWNDPAIAADNPGAKLPDQRIAPVNRSDESGTTANFTDWLHQTAGAVWTYEPDGNWPVKGGEAAEGTSGVVDAVKNGKGTIGYADESQAGELGVAKIKVGSEYVAPSAEAAAAVLDKSKESTDAGKYVFTFTLDRTVEGTYPVTLVSYQIACTKYDSADKGKLVQALYKYIISPEGQDAAAKNAGSAPISDKLRQQIQPAVDAIGSGS